MVKRVVLGAGIGALGAASAFGVRRWWKTWGVVPEEAKRPLPGDEIVSPGETLITRGLTIDAAPGAVWPWLIQMGYGRAGWYSYDQLDMKGRSAAAIVPEFQSLAIGDLIPTHPSGGFVVKVLEPERALVLYLDGALAREQAKGQAASISVRETPGLAASDRFLRAASPVNFAVSWAFALEPVGLGQTRLIERIRGRFGPATTGSQVMLPLMGFGVFVMMRKQMLGIRDGVERAAVNRAARAEEAPTEAAPTTVARDRTRDRSTGSSVPAAMEEVPV
jgi:hypothetical protein